MNGSYTIDKRSLVASAVILFLIILICGLMSVLVLNDPAVRYSQVMVRAAMAIRDGYPDPVDWQNMFVSARRSMTDELDRFSGYVNHESLMQFEEDLTGGYFGIGISVTSHNFGLLIMSVREGSPAAQAGILNGDIIIGSDTTSLAGMSAVDAIRQIKGKENTTLSATFFRPSTGDTLKAEIVRGRIDFQHIPYAGITSDSMIYIRLLDFGSGASTDLKISLDSLVEQTDVHIKGVILDLRDNPGGLFSEARKITELFLEKGSFIVGTSSRSRWRKEKFFAENGGSFENFPLAVIVNKGSASASEILAGALKYSNHAVLIGDTTYGKGLVQGFINLPDGDGLRLTISRYFFEGNRFINAIDSLEHLVSDKGTGLAPDTHYSFAEEHPFYLELERSLLLLEFAHKHQDVLVAAGNDKNEKRYWLQLFQQFALDSGFSFKSDMTEKAEEFYALAEDNAIRKLAAKTVENAEYLDRQLFFEFGDQIWMRLRQIAYERKFGTYRAYKDVIVPESELIALAASALKEKEQR